LFYPPEIAFQSDTALLLLISAFTGMITLLSIPNRRRNGIIAGAAGLSVAVAIYFICIP
jgi:hypothetical protein